MKLNNFLIPIIIIAILFIAFGKFNYCELNFHNIQESKGAFISSILYSNYNLLTIIPIIITISEIIKNKNQIKYISIISFLILLLLSFSIFFILINANKSILMLDMPVVAIAGTYGIFYKFFYCIIVGFAILTSAVSIGYSYLQKFEENKRSYNIRAYFLICFTLISLFIGFSKLIEVLYPVFGVIGLIQSFFIIKTKKL